MPAVTPTRGLQPGEDGPHLLHQQKGAALSQMGFWHIHKPRSGGLMLVPTLLYSLRRITAS